MQGGWPQFQRLVNRNSRFVLVAVGALSALCIYGWLTLGGGLCTVSCPPKTVRGPDGFCKIPKKPIPESMPAPLAPRINIMKELNLPDYTPPNCVGDRGTPSIDVVFAKTHKTGSSTIATILYRFADFRPELRVAVPNLVSNGLSPKRGNQCWPDKFLDGRMSPPPYNMAMAHGRYTPNFVDLNFRPQVKKITIVRDPVTRLPSAYKEFSLSKKYKMRGKGIPFEDQIKEVVDNRAIGKWGVIGNSMCEDLGAHLKCPYAFGSGDSCAEQALSEFDLIMVMERFDESLALLQHELCWSLSDVLYFAHKAHGTGLSARDWLGPERVEKILTEIAPFDAELYDEASALFEKKVLAYDEGCTHDRNDASRHLCVADHAALIREGADKLAKFCPEAYNHAMYTDEGERVTVAEIYEKSLKRGLTPDQAELCMKMSMDAGMYMKTFFDRAWNEENGFSIEDPADIIESGGYPRPTVGDCPGVDGKKGVLGCGPEVWQCSG